MVAGLGGGVAELDVFGDVASGQGDGAVTVDAGHGERSVGTDGVDGPVVAVSDALPHRCSQESFVASCRDHIADRDLEAVAEFETGVAELAEGSAVVVDGGVDGVDVVVGGGRDRHVLAAVAGAGPVVGEVVDVLDERCREDAIMIQVGVEAGGVAVSQLQGRGRFPLVVETVDRVELDRPAGRAEFTEHPATPDRLELVGVTDQHQPPPLGVGQVCELVEVAGADHAGLVDDHRRPHRQPPRSLGRPIGSSPLVQQLRDRVRSHGGLGFEDTGRLRRRRHTEHHPSLPGEVVDGGGEHRGLAGTGRADHQHQPIRPRDRGGGLGLHHIEPARVHGGRRCGRVELCVHRPADDVFLLGQHVAAGVMTGRRFDPHRPPIRTPSTSARVVGVEIDTLRQDRVGDGMQRLRPLRAVHPWLWTSDIADGLQDVEAMPRRTLLGHSSDDFADRHRLLDLRMVDRRCVDAVGERLRGHAHRRRLGQPP